MSSSSVTTVLIVQMRDVDGEPMDNPKLALMEAVCISFFTIEFLLRYMST